MRTQLVDGLFADLLQIARFLLVHSPVLLSNMYYLFIRTAGSILGTGINTFISDWDRVTSAVNIIAIILFVCSA